jgi:hypothetical protein
VASAGDLNGDGYDDLIVGTQNADTGGGVDSGASYVVFGKASGFAANLDLAQLDGTNGFRLDGAAALDGSGYSVASAGDLNGDGYDDLVVGAPNASPNGTASRRELRGVRGRVRRHRDDDGHGCGRDVGRRRGRRCPDRGRRRRRFQWRCGRRPAGRLGPSRSAKPMAAAAPTRWRSTAQASCST